MISDSIISKGQIVGFDRRYFINEQLLREMFKRQMDVNHAYDPHWLQNGKKDSYLTAALFEFTGEAMREMEGQWKFFGNCPVNIEKAVFELVDATCFLISYCVLSHAENIDSTDEKIIIDGLFSSNSITLICDEKGNVVSPWVELTKYLLYYCTDIYGISFFLTHALNLIGCTNMQFIDAYNKKSEINIQRAQGGAMTGDYDKSKEVAPKIDTILTGEYYA